MLYAAYGSNLHPVRLSARVRAARLLGAGSVTGWELRFNKRGQTLTPFILNLKQALFKLLSLPQRSSFAKGNPKRTMLAGGNRKFLFPLG